MITGQKYCVSARNRLTGFTEDITGPMTYMEAINYTATGMKYTFPSHIYFRVSKYPFKRHKK